MLENWRLLDTGLASAARNIALNRALLEARHADESPSTLRFLRFARSVLLASRHSADEELNVAYCAAQKLPVQRRITGGLAWLADERQLGWELYLHRRETGTVSMETLARRIGHAAATALAALGIDARYRARNEIEVDGRVICMLASAAEGGGVLFQSLLLIDPDLECTACALRLPSMSIIGGVDVPGRGELDGRIAALGSRMTGLKQVLGRSPELNLVRRNLAEAFESEFDVEFSEGDLNLSEHRRHQRALTEIENTGWVDFVTRPITDTRIVEAVHKVRGVVVRATLKYQASSRTIKQVWFSGDFALNPRRSVADLEAVLRNVPLERLEAQVRSFFASHAVQCGALMPGDFVAAVRLAAGQPLTA